MAGTAKKEEGEVKGWGSSPRPRAVRPCRPLASAAAQPEPRRSSKRRRPGRGTQVSKANSHVPVPGCVQGSVSSLLGTCDQIK